MKYLLIVGAPKCGTSSLFNWLAQHPDMAPSNPKETFFLMDPDHPSRGTTGHSLHKDGDSGFAAYFTGCRGAVRLEATTHHYYQRTAIDFARRNKDVRVHMVLRKPSLRLLSLFRYARDVRNQIRSSLSFDRYVEKLLSNTVDHLRDEFLSDTTFWIMKRQVEQSDYAKWIEYWLEAIGEHRFSVGVLEEYAARPAIEVARILRLLELDAEIARNFDYFRMNRSYRVAAPWLHRIARAGARVLPAGSARELLKGRYMLAQRHLARADSGFEQGRAAAEMVFDRAATRLATIPVASRAPAIWGLA